MNEAMEQRTVVEVGRDTTITENITRVSIKGRKIEIFRIPEYLQSREGANHEEIKGTKEYIEKYFPIVKASTLSLEDELLKHEPKTNYQRIFKNELISAIKSGLSDFRAQGMDPCFDAEGNICFKAGIKPAVGISPEWWYKTAKEFMPEKESRLGTTKERIAFLGLLIKYLIEKEGYTISDAWKAVCNQSKDLGHYYDSEDAKHYFEGTGSRQVGEWHDLANTYKITVDDEPGAFSLFGGYYSNYGQYYPLANHIDYEAHIGEYPGDFSDDCTGWIVLSV